MTEPVSNARKDLTAQLVRFAVVEDIGIKTRSLRARTEEKVSALDVKADAESVATERAALVGPRRDFYTLRVRGQQFKRERGETITVVFPRFGLTSGRDALILDISETTAEDITTFKLLI